jgi:hypothetical protein
MTCLPLCCPQCCTHRLWDELPWSDSVTNKQICGYGRLSAPAVVNSWRNGDYVYFVVEQRKAVDSVPRFAYRAEKWHKDGTRAWQTDDLFVTASTGFIGTDHSDGTAICSDGTKVWVAIAENAATGSPGGLTTMWRLNASTGATDFAGDPGCGDSLLSGLKVRSLCPDGTGKVLVGHQGGIGGADFINTWHDDARVLHVDCCRR